MRTGDWLVMGLVVLGSAGCEGADSRTPDGGRDGGVPCPDDPACDGDADADAAAVDAPLRVLFVGNSYTFRNDLPAVVRALGEATPGAAVEVESVVAGGASLADHWTSTGARERIETGDFDAVVLQGQSLEPIVDSVSFDGYAALLAGAVHDAGARAVWFATWARRAGDPFYEEGWVDTPAAMASAIEERYRAAAFLGGGFVARVGAAWLLSANGHFHDVALHDQDGSHPSPEGTLLTACVLLQALTGQTPQVPEPPPLGVDPETAMYLCAFAPRAACVEGRTFCGGDCVSLQDDFANCGACGNECPGNEPCRDGVCGCPAGYDACASPPEAAVSSRGCVHLETDRGHCGACNASCGLGELCQDAACACLGAEYTGVPYADLTALDPGCVPAPDSPDAAIAACNAAIHQHCAAHGCFTSGFGPVFSVNDLAMLSCVSGDVQTTTYETLQTWSPACNGTEERLGPSCTTAVHRYCASLGAVSGFGPVDGDAQPFAEADEPTITCVSHATIERTDFATLAQYAPDCDGTTERWGAACSSAIGLECRTLGHVAGFGPVDTAGDEVDVACVDE